jgi:UDP-glucose 4-epimerase
LVYAGSSSVYHEPEANPYSFTKAKAEEYCWLYNRHYGVEVAVARFFNVYGPRQITEGAYATVVGVFEKQRAACEQLTITGDGEQRRDFTHVSDIVDGLIAIADGEAYGELYDFGTGKNHSINEVAAMFDWASGHIPARPGEARNTLADIGFATSVLDWRPKEDLEEYVKGFLRKLDCEKD